MTHALMCGPQAVEESERDDDDEGGQAMLTQLESVGTQMESVVQHMEEAVVDEPVPVSAARAS